MNPPRNFEKDIRIEKLIEKIWCDNVFPFQKNF